MNYIATVISNPAYNLIKSKTNYNNYKIIHSYNKFL